MSFFSNILVTADYRYGYQGQETDDEIKGEGNSYGYEARMYDSRVGRWLSRDALSGKKPYLSPYQSSKNNPLIYADPDGNDEFLKIVINQEGKKPIVITSNEPIRESIYMAGYILYSGETRVFPEQVLHDFTTIITLDLNKEGQLMNPGSILKEVKLDGGTIKETLLMGWFGSGAERGEIVDKSSNFSMPGGFYMTSENGLGTIFTSENAEYVGNIDDLATALSAINSANTIAKLKGGSANGLDELDKFAVDKILKAFAPKVKEQLTKSSVNLDEGAAKTRKLPMSKTLRWTKGSNGDWFAKGKEATSEEMKKGDTLGGNNGKTVLAPK